MVGADKVQRLTAGARKRNLKSAMGQDLMKDTTNLRLVIDDQDAATFFQRCTPKLRLRYPYKYDLPANLKNS